MQIFSLPQTSDMNHCDSAHELYKQSEMIESTGKAY